MKRLLLLLTTALLATATACAVDPSSGVVEQHNENDVCGMPLFTECYPRDEIQSARLCGDACSPYLGYCPEYTPSEEIKCNTDAVTGAGWRLGVPFHPYPGCDFLGLPDHPHRCLMGAAALTTGAPGAWQVRVAARASSAARLTGIGAPPEGSE